MHSDRFQRCRLVYVFCSILLMAPAAWGQGDASKKLNAAIADFTKKVNDARSAVLAEYNRTITSLKNAPGLTASARKDKVDTWKSAKQMFEESSRFPGDDEFAGLELMYYLAVNRAFLPALKIIDDVMNQAVKSDNTSVANDAQEKKNKLEMQFLGSNVVTANSAWHGTLTRSKETIPYHLNIGRKTEGGSFKGHVEDNPGVAGNWSYDVEGQMAGLGIEYVMTKSTRGKFQNVKVQGIISGNRLIATVMQTAGGKPVKGLLILRRK